MNTQNSFNRYIDLVEPSRSVVLSARLRQMLAQGADVVNLTGGEPDFDTPVQICEEAARQMLAGNTHYGDSKGDPQLRGAIAEKLRADSHAHYSPDNILITPGGKYAIYLAVQAIVNPGDEVLWLTPGWVSYPSIVTLCGAKPVAVRLEAEDNFALSCEKLEEHTSERTRLLIINYPNNPTGAVLTGSDMEELKKYLMRHPDIYCLSDEIYEKLVYDGCSSLSPASVPELSERILVVNGFSKCSAMTGWRIGYLAMNPEICTRVMKIFQHSMSCVSGFIQKAAITALHLEEETQKMRRAYEMRRNNIYEELKDIPNVHFEKPSGAFYAWVKFDTSLSSEELCSLLLEKPGIGGIPGSAFGEEEECRIRFCYASSDDTIREFTSRLKAFAPSVPR